MAKFDSDIRQLVSDLARERAGETGEKYKSARRYFERIFTTTGTQKINNPKFRGQSEETKEKVKSIVSEVKAKKEKDTEIETFEPEPETDTVLIAVYGTFTHGSSDDVRDRFVRQEMDANEFKRRGIEYFMEQVSYVTHVENVQEIKIDGANYDFDSENFDF